MPTYEPNRELLRLQARRLELLISLSLPRQQTFDLRPRLLELDLEVATRVLQR